MEKKNAKSSKTLAKAMGLKSTFVIGDEKIFITSFGNGFKADAEKMVEKEGITDYKNTFAVRRIDSEKSSGRKLSMHGRKITMPDGRTASETDFDIPNIDSNMLHAKDTIEKMFFGKTFKDNIHIQIAYNIMDIKKIFSVYANIVVNTVNSLNRENFCDDFLGFGFKTQNSYATSELAFELKKAKVLSVENERFLIDFVNLKEAKRKEFPAIAKLKKEAYEINKDMSYAKKLLEVIGKYKITPKHYDAIADNHRAFLGYAKSMEQTAVYFPNLFYTNNRFDKEKAYELLRILGILRHESFHEQNATRTWLYCIDQNTDEALKNTINNIFDTKLNKINSDFIKNSKKNIFILKQIYPNNKKLIQEYYDFAVRKAYKNLGFSIKNIRETILTFDDAKHLTAEKYDSVRGKMYNLFDFVIYNYFVNDNELSNDFVDELRASMDEEKKRAIYVRYAESVWSKVKKHILGVVVSNMSEEKINSLNGNVEDDELAEKIQNPNDISLFAKTIYCISMFLDGKEINMFISSLINKLENINSLNETLKFNKFPIEFKNEYNLFENSDKYAKDLTFVKSIAKMGKTKKAKKGGTEKVKSRLYYDSAALFGEYDTEKVDKLYHLGDLNATSSQKALRNFMTNNVINSNKFIYVARFINPGTARDIMQSESLVSYTLTQIPKSQLIRYCQTTEISINAKEPDIKDMAEKLTKLLVDVKLSTFTNVKQQVKPNSWESVKKEKYKAIIGLYLTVLYLIVKSIVRINTSYTIAIGILERDAAILNEKYGCKQFGINNLITYKFIQEKYLKNKRVLNSVKNNSQLYSDNMFKKYRNNIAHLSVVSALPKYAKELKNVDNMFDVYHFIMFNLIFNQLNIESNYDDSNKKSAQIKQRAIVELDKLGEDMGNGLSMIQSVELFGTPCKNFIYAINIPFAYNPARYINLSNKEKFIEGYGK